MYIQIRSSEKITKSPNLRFFGVCFADRLKDRKSLVDDRSRIFWILYLVTSLKFKPCYTLQTGVVQGGSLVLGERFVLAQTPSFTRLFCTTGSRQDTLYYKLLYMFGMEFFDVVVKWKSGL